MLKVSLKRYFITGLLVIVPIWGTVLVLKTLFVTLDGLLGDFLEKYFPQRYIPGQGILKAVQCDEQGLEDQHRPPDRHDDQETGDKVAFQRDFQHGIRAGLYNLAMIQSFTRTCKR